MVAHCDHLAVCIKDGAGVVAPFFDIGGKRGAPQGRAHLFGNGVVDILEDFELDGIGLHGHWSLVWSWPLVVGQEIKEKPTPNDGSPAVYDSSQIMCDGREESGSYS